MEYVQISTRSCWLLLCCKGWHRRGALLPLSPVPLLPCARCRGKVSEGSPGKDLPKSSGGLSLGEAGCGFVQISSRLHCHESEACFVVAQNESGFSRAQTWELSLASGLCPECVGTTGTSPTSGFHPAAATGALIFANSKLLIGSSALSIVAHNWGKGLSRNQQALTGEFLPKREVGAPAGLGREGFPWWAARQQRVT